MTDRTAPSARTRSAGARFRAAVAAERRSSGVTYAPGDRLELDIRLYLPERALTFHDIDNRLKDIMDALQGRVGGPKGKQPIAPTIVNDRQVWRVTIEKGLSTEAESRARPPPDQALSPGLIGGCLRSRAIASGRPPKKSAGPPMAGENRIPRARASCRSSPPCWSATRQDGPGCLPCSLCQEPWCRGTSARSSPPCRDALVARRRRSRLRGACSAG